MSWEAFDLDGFRTIHLNFQAPWLAMTMLVITASGLGHIQVAALFARHYLGPQNHLALRILGLLLLISVPLNGFREGLLGWHLASLAFALCYFYFSSRDMVKRAIWAFILSGIVQIVLKQVLPDRMRPSNFAWAKPLEHVYKTGGFPSGHSTTSFAIGTSLAIGFFIAKKPGTAFLMLGFGVLVGLSRVYVGVHYPTDVLAGACVGISCAAIVNLIMPYEDQLKDLPSPD